jgi:PST family polysaccharide transporter
VSKETKNTYGQILKSSALIGSSSALGVCFGIIRNKAMAVILGPAGMGLAGNFTSIIELVRTLAGMGVSNSGVRQIAEAVGSGDEQRVARTVKTLRRVALWSGTAGALLLVALCVPAAKFTFKSDIQIKDVIFDTRAQIGAIALLAVAVLFADISGGQMALVQGMRRIGDLAKINVLGALYGTLFSIPIVYIWGARGVVPSLICVAGMGILTSWWYARKVKVPDVKMERGHFLDETRALLKMGVVFMASGLMTTGVAYLVRVIITRQISLDAAGYYQAAWGLGGFYIGYVVSAMGTDFYPRLTAVAHDKEECNRMVNEQTEVGILLAGPGLIATLTFSGLLMHLFYSKQFGDAPLAVELLRWICLGMILRVASWPMGFVLLAKGERKLYFWTEFLSNLMYVGFVWGGARTIGLKGVGIAFFAMYSVYWVGIYAVVRRLTGFRWSAANVRLAFLFVPLIVAVFAIWYWLPPIGVAILGVLAACGSGIYSLRTLCALIPIKRFPRMAQNLLLFLRLVPSGTDAPTG